MYHIPYIQFQVSGFQVSGDRARQVDCGDELLEQMNDALEYKRTTYNGLAFIEASSEYISYLPLCVQVHHIMYTSCAHLEDMYV